MRGGRWGVPRRKKVVMFGIGTGELILLGIIALVVLGPEKFPEFAKIAMRAFRDLRGYVDDIKSEMAAELKPVQREIQQLAYRDPEEYIDKLSNALASVDDEEKKTPSPTETQDSASVTTEAGQPSAVPAGDSPSTETTPSDGGSDTAVESNATRSLYDD